KRHEGEVEHLFAPLWQDGGFGSIDGRLPSMACSDPRASPSASYDHIHIPPKEWVHGKSRSLHSSSHRHKHTLERATHDTAQSSLPQHHPTSPASPIYSSCTPKTICRKIGDIWLKISRMPTLGCLHNLFPQIRQVP